jgi:hypothetical protein
MQKVSVRGADGKKAIVALIRCEGTTTFVCPVDRYLSAKEGADVVVGFPTKDVEFLEQTSGETAH